MARTALRGALYVGAGITLGAAVFALLIGATSGPNPILASGVSSIMGENGAHCDGRIARAGAPEHVTNFTLAAGEAFEVRIPRGWHGSAGVEIVADGTRFRADSGADSPQMTPPWMDRYVTCLEWQGSGTPGIGRFLNENAGVVSARFQR